MAEERHIYSGSGGLALLELLVSLTLTSLLALMAFVSLNLSIKMISRGQNMTDKLQELRVGENMLRRSLCSAVRGTMAAKVYFAGTSQELKFLTLIPLEAHNLGGVYHWRVLHGQDEAGRGVLVVEQTRNLNWQRDPEGVEIRQIILRDVAAVAFTYGQAAEETQSWEGERQKRLPDWVKVNLTPRGQNPQEWIIPIYAAQDQTTRGPQ